jgi:hypothetical protein
VWSDDDRRKARADYERHHQRSLDIALIQELRKQSIIQSSGIEERLIVAELLKDDRFSQSEVEASIERLKQKGLIVEPKEGFVHIVRDETA